MSDGHAVNVGQTYAGLRAAMVLLVLLLFGSVVYQVVSTALTGDPCVQPSLSAYYYTPARPAFIAALCAIGSCLIIYRGASDIENVALDFSGFLAFVVAFVPTSLQDGACDTSNVPLLGEVLAASTNNVVVLFVVGAVALAATWWLPSPRYAVRDARVSWSLLISTTALLGGFVFFWIFPALFAEYAHGVAATALFIGFLVVVFENSRRSARQRYRRGYRTIAWSMLATVALGGAGMAADLDRIVFWLETALIVEFAAFWVIQTVELGSAPASAAEPTVEPAS
jgi:hypothetical protein